jgi:hypothetical protein
MTKEASILKAAICEFKKKNIKILKESTNPHFKSKYADLATILDAVEKDAAECGLIITSTVAYVDTSLILTTRLSHKDTEEFESTIFPIFGSKPQELGSSITYARRYNIQCLLNLAADDDDGQAANTSQQVKKADPAAAKRALYVAIMKELDEAKDAEDLEFGWLARGNDLHTIEQYSKEGYDALNKRYLDLKKKFAEMNNG